jgi:hypothetical protein
MAERFSRGLGPLRCYGAAAAGDPDIYCFARGYREDAQIAFPSFTFIDHGHGALHGLDRREAGREVGQDPRLKQWFHRLDAVIILLLLAGIRFVVTLKGRVGAKEAA